MKYFVVIFINKKKIIDWSTYHKQDATTDSNDKKRNVDLTQWDQDFFKVRQEMLFEIIMVIVFSFK